MLDFAKSIMTGNASGTKEFNTEADLRRWCIEHQYTYTPTHGGYYRLEDDKPGRNRPDLEAHVKAGNSKVGNAKDKNDKDIKVGDFVNVTGKKGKVTRIISDDVVEVFFDNSGTYYPDRTDRYYASECTKIGNSIGGGVQSETVLTEAKDGSQYWVEKTSKSKVGNASFDAVLSAIQDVKDWAVTADNWANGGKFSATNITNALSHCKNACDKAMRLAQEYDRNSK